MLHGQRPSFSQLASAARPYTSAGTLTTQAVIDIVTGKTQDPADEIVRALASALALPVEEVARWVGRPLEVGTPYSPPNGSDRLSRKQREALDHIIRVMIDREDVTAHAAPTNQAGVRPADDEDAEVRELRPETEEEGLPWASHPKKGRESTGRQMRRQMDEVGEENQDPEQ